MAVYPNSVFPWTSRRNNIDVVWAADPNSLAAEIQAIESVIGTTPNVENNPPTGNSVTYSTMNSRVSAANNNTELPYAYLRNSNGFFIEAGQQIYNSYNVQNDPYNIWNGTDGTIPCNGWWSVQADQKWDQHGNRFHGGNVLFMYLNGDVLASDIWDWDAFFGVTLHYSNNVLESNGYSHLVWMGELHKGDRIRLLSVNNTFCPGIGVTHVNLKFFCHRTLPGTFQSG
jgi:hypothetical protein